MLIGNIPGLDRAGCFDTYTSATEQKEERNQEKEAGKDIEERSEEGEERGRVGEGEGRGGSRKQRRKHWMGTKGYTRTHRSKDLRLVPCGLCTAWLVTVELPKHGGEGVHMLVSPPNMSSH